MKTYLSLIELFVCRETHCPTREENNEGEMFGNLNHKSLQSTRSKQVPYTNVMYTKWHGS